MLITDDYNACITDAGLYASVVQVLHRDRIPLPPQWPHKSPEELTAGTRTFYTDVYSFGCTVHFVSWFLLSLVELFLTGSHLQIYAEKSIFKNNISIRGLQKIMERGHLEILGNAKPPQMSEALWDLLRRCWSVNPASRPTMMEVVAELSALVPN